MASVTLPGASGGIVTVQAGSGDHIFVAQIIANTILSVGGSAPGGMNVTSVSANDGDTTIPAAISNGKDNILYLTGPGGGSLTIPSGIEYAVDLITGPETITGSNIQVEKYSSAAGSVF